MKQRFGNAIFNCLPCLLSLANCKFGTVHIYSAHNNKIHLLLIYFKVKWSLFGNNKELSFSWVAYMCASISLWSSKYFAAARVKAVFPEPWKRKIKLQFFYPEAKININRHTKYVNIDVKFHQINMVLLLTRGPWTRTCPGKGNFSLLNNLSAVEDKSTDSPSRRKACKA
jgi:hypothetical protein